MKKHRWLLGALAVIFLGIYGWFATPLPTDTGVGPRFDWPDETANYFWITRYAKTGQLIEPEPLNVAAQNQIHPRSFNVLPGGATVPGSFLGFIVLYGSVVKVLGAGVLPYLTPLLAVLGALAFYGIIRKMFEPNVALLATVLLLIHPAWWYYAATPLLPNVAFVSFLLMSVYLMVKKMPDAEAPGRWFEPGASRASWNAALAAGALAGLALAIRPSEVIWVGALYLVILLWTSRTLTLLRLLLFLAMTVAAIVPAFYNQAAIYGNWFTTGYNQLEVAAATAANQACQVCSITRSLIAPFGFHPSLAAYNFWVHYVSRFWWLSLFAVLGLVVFLTRPQRRPAAPFVYLLVSLMIGLWLAFYYGSWQFSDQLTVSLNTLGLSYVRYWLPGYLLALPFVALGLLWFTTFLPKGPAALLLVLMLGFIGYQSVHVTLVAKADSLLPVRERIAGYKRTAAAVFGATEPESVIVTVRKDKVFFPDRKVIHTFSALSLNPELLGFLPALVTMVPTYYYALGPEPTLEFENGVRLEEVGRFGQEVLYRVEKNNFEF
ncbi:MAG: hypothetical protein A3J59_02770 [Candidatus Buchananbacteria bacterium RIFCSPHIGHO2_02_FULL_56_16]|uniref:Uncharacterized protein n=1 Tax=Candidatus Buchananbacteria bacterium RIFCSPHIGHO2_02_FULL_56_16 TaxID=1797542 RepID=A0A1G1YFX4_9BACT|nr:MAG: hypothetical protein A3J59_02770 [Candidatus Buchananbacteria bacterium RIFCSPHIGHO2_02_FULL_56_16]